MAQPGFHLEGLEQFRGGGGSRWMKIIPWTGNGGLGPIDSRLKAGLARQLVRELTQERIVTDPDMREAIGGLSMVGGGLRIQDDKILSQDNIITLLRNRLADVAVNVDEMVVATEIPVDRLVGDRPVAIAPHQGAYIFNPDHWQAWVADIRANVLNRVANNVPQNAPAGANVPVDEIHPWMFGGYINLDLTNGQAVAAPVPARNDRSPWIISLLQIIMAVSPVGVNTKISGINHLALGVAIVTSGGNMTNARLRRIVSSVARETIIAQIDISRDMVMKGWDFLSIYWDRRAGAIGRDFQDLFHALGDQGRRISLRLALMCEQTEYKMLTGIVTTVRAINGFQDFPWEQLNEAIRGITGRDELLHVAEYAQFIAPDNIIQPAALAAPAPPPNGGHWAGWLFSLQGEAPAGRTIANYCNLLYAALQLSILVGGNQSLRQYQGLDNHVVAARPLIDAWVGNYVTALTQNAPAFQIVAHGVAPITPSLNNIRGRNV